MIGLFSFSIVEDDSSIKNEKTLYENKYTIDQNPKTQLSLASYENDNLINSEMLFKDNQFKAFMDYKAITDTTSLQYQIQKNAYTDKNGFRRHQEDYIVAIGSGFSEKCGDRYRVVLSNSNTFSIVVGDIKNPKHTDNTNMYVNIDDDKISILEFIVDSDMISKQAWLYGDVSKMGLEGQIVRLERIGSVE